jgi:hypothetical protein
MMDLLPRPTRSIRCSFGIGLPRSLGAEYRLVQLGQAFLQRDCALCADQLDLEHDLLLPDKLYLQHGYARLASL